MTRVTRFYILISKNLSYFLKVGSFLILAIATGHCQSAEEKAKEIVKENEARAKANALSYKVNACPNYGILKPDEIKQATYTVLEGEERVALIVPGDFRKVHPEDEYTSTSLYAATEALSIGWSRVKLKEWIEHYRDKCGNKNIPYWDEIAYNIEVKKIIAEMASSLKIKPSEILDLRRPTTRFRLAWFNSKENPSIYNQTHYDNEFKFQEDKESLKKIREYKYVITDDYRLSGDYDFEQNGYHLTTEDSESIQYDFGDSNRLTYYAPEDLRFPTDVIFKISPQKAQKFKSQWSGGLNAITLSKIFPKIYIHPEGQRWRKGKDTSAKIKYFSIETLKYHIEFENEIYKNY